MPKPKPPTGKSRVTIIFECDSCHFEQSKHISLLELYSLVGKAMGDQKIKVSVEEIDNV